MLRGTYLAERSVMEKGVGYSISPCKCPKAPQQPSPRVILFSKNHPRRIFKDRRDKGGGVFFVTPPMAYEAKCQAAVVRLTFL